MVEGLLYRDIRVRFTPSGFSTPYFIGSQIRGALGYSLKRTMCINPSFQCEGCFAADNCLYYEWYEKPGVYHPFRLDFELGKPYYDVGIYLFGNACEKLPYVISALERMLTQTGLGKERIKIENFECFVDGVSVRRNGQYHLKDMSPRRLEVSDEHAPALTKVTLQTPLRLKYQNRFIRRMDHLHLPTLINSIYQRWQTLQGNKREKLPFRVEGNIVQRFGTFEDLTRYSNRQKGKLQIGGLVGEIVIEGLDDTSYRLLRIAETIGAGKQTVFGLGKIKVDTI